jgi:NAD-dependent SIR2 family protein deacetylase
MLMTAEHESAPTCNLIANSLAAKAERHKICLIIINYNTTPIASIADVIIRENAAPVLPQIADALEAL